MAPSAASSDVAGSAFPRSLPSGRSGFDSSTEIADGTIHNNNDAASRKVGLSSPSREKAAEANRCPCVGGTPTEQALAQCEDCARWFEAANHQLWVGWSGTSITCVHCFFAAHAAVLFDDAAGEDEREDTLVFLAEMHDQSGQPIGGIAGYRARFAADHDRARCPWAAYGCLLCDSREIDEPSVESDD